MDHLHHASNESNPIYTPDSNQSDSLRVLQSDMNESKIDKLAWLRSQLVGRDTEFDTPFGKRILTYADHTASGRALHYIENFILSDILPFYG